MAKERRTRDIKKLLSKKAPLPSKTEVNKSVAKITGKDKVNVDFSKPTTVNKPNVIESRRVKATQNTNVVEKRERGRPKKAHGRVKFTTIIDPLKRDELKILAIRQGRNVADILDELIEKYLKKNLKI